MDIVQNFYDEMAGQYDKLFQDWTATTCVQALILERIFLSNGFDNNARILDCACGIGTQSVGLARRGYTVTASDISEEELKEAARRAQDNDVCISFYRADFRVLEDVFSERYDIVMAMDNALPHMLTAEDLSTAVRSICSRLAPGGLFVASIRDYDALLASKPPYSPPYIHQLESGKRVSFQTWDWEGEHYHLTQYIIEDGDALSVSKFDCEYRALRREELTSHLLASGCREVRWLFPEETDFYQPIVAARK